jgi:hypothetical protein
MGRWKAVRPQASEALELYDLQTDVAEKNDVAQIHPDVVARIETYLKTARTESAQWPIKKPEQKTGSTGSDRNVGQGSAKPS